MGEDPNVERYDPDLWTDEFAFLNQPGQAEIQTDLFYDYRTNVNSYPKWQAWLRENQTQLLVIWGKFCRDEELYPCGVDDFFCGPRVGPADGGYV